jgi:hypothetical protein
MKRNSFYKNRFVYISLVLLLSFALSSCGKKIRIVDPVELVFLAQSITMHSAEQSINARYEKPTMSQALFFLCLQVQAIC